MSCTVCVADRSSTLWNAVQRCCGDFDVPRQMPVHLSQLASNLYALTSHDGVEIRYLNPVYTCLQKILPSCLGLEIRYRTQNFQDTFADTNASHSKTLETLKTARGANHQVNQAGTLHKPTDVLCPMSNVIATHSQHSPSTPKKPFHLQF